MTQSLHDLSRHLMGPLVSGHLIDPWAEEGPQCRSSLTWQAFQCSSNEFYFEVRWVVNPQCQPSKSKHLLTKQMQFTPAKLKSTPVQWGSPSTDRVTLEWPTAPAAIYTGVAGMTTQSPGGPWLLEKHRSIHYQAFISIHLLLICTYVLPLL